MTVYCYELKKLLFSVALWGFVAICLLFNIFLSISSSGDKYADFVGAVSRDTGYILGPSFSDKLSEFRAGNKEAAYLEQLKYETVDVTDVFEGYETKGIGEKYIAAAGITGRFAEAMGDKYAALQKVVDEKAAKEESLSLYFAGATYSRHQQLFNGLMGWLLVEGALISALLALLAVGYENNCRTGDIVYSTKTGRHILRSKMMASISAGLGVYAVLALFTFLVYFSVNEYGSIWGSSVSSVFNYRYDFIAGYRPFVTWRSLSVLTYFLAMLGMSGSVILCFSFMAFGIGVLTRNHYIGFLIFLAANAAIVVLPMQIPQTLAAGSYIGYYSMLTPVWLWLKHSIWFTDGDIDILWPHFETWGLGVSLLTLTIFCISAAIYFRKKDLT